MKLEDRDIFDLHDMALIEWENHRFMTWAINAIWWAHAKALAVFVRRGIRGRRHTHERTNPNGATPRRH